MDNEIVYIFGAKATAAGLYKALLVLEPGKKIKAFLVSDTAGNVPEIWGCPVKAISSVAGGLSEDEKSGALVYVAVPKLVHKEVRGVLEGYGFSNLIMLDSHMEADLMGRYFEAVGRFKSVHGLSFMPNDDSVPFITIYAASFYKDKLLTNPPVMPSYVKSLYLGCDGAQKVGVDISNQADFYDNTGDNISALNPNRCEMTGHYWVWKNMLGSDDVLADNGSYNVGMSAGSLDEYVGICHYRRILDLSDDDLKKMAANNVDVVLPYPMIHYPNAAIQHTWYVPEKDWELMRKVVEDLYPEYGEKFDEVFSAPEFYNYNMLVAKKSVFADYCAWLYPILDRIEELSGPKGSDRHDRYTAYLSESLETLYYMSNLNHLEIYHTGRLLYT